MIDDTQVQSLSHPVLRGKFILSLYLGALVAIPPLSIDMALSALPLIHTELHASTTQTGMTLSLFLLGFSAAPLLLGPLADRFGRRPILIWSLMLFSVAGIACALASSIHFLLFWRLLQGAGAGAGSVLPMVIIRDLYEGKEARKQLSQVTALQGIAPAVAPIIGAFIMSIAGWHTIFGSLGVIGILVFLLTLFWFRESASTIGVSLHPRELMQRYREVLSHPLCRGYSLVQACTFACLFSYITGAPLVLMDVYHLSPGIFSLLFACTAISIICGSIISGKLATRMTPTSTTLKWGLSLLFLSAATVSSLALLGPISLLLLMLLLMMNTFSFGLIAPLVWHEVLHPLPRLAGIVSAFVGCLQMLFGALASILVAHFFDGSSARSLSITMLFFALGACAAGKYVSKKGSVKESSLF